ncbi:MAG TPA: ribosome maturation factor RimM [Longimicrobiales bacterium]|nr:ribosome maturation factor RimM [Longimicrobiales bacterium]
MENRLPDPEFLVVGHMSRAHGTRGEVVVTPLTDRPDEVFATGRRVLMGDEDGRGGASAPELVIESVRRHKRGLLTKFDGITDRNGAELLQGRYLLIPASEAGTLEENELFYHQLLGLTVETAGGVVVGRVREVFETEPDHMLEVKGEGRLHLVPFTSRIVTEVDLDAGRIVIEPPEGLLDL